MADGHRWGWSLRFFQGGNGGLINRCVDNCTAGQAVWTDITGGWSGDTKSGILPYEIYKDVCGPAGPDSGCGHLIAGSNRVWETITGAKANPLDVTWYVNSPDNLTKGTLADRSYINQLAFEPSDQSTVIVGTNDGNVQIGRGLGTGSNQSTWVNVTANNLVLPNRPILDVAFDPTTTTAPIGYAAVGGFNANTPPTPGHVFRVVCTANCASFTWSNKTGNLPDIPVDSIIANPKFPQQVFAGTDWGLYFTNDITAVSPTWYRFDSGLPHAMIWDMQIDRGATTLSIWTRSRGAYAYPLPSAPLPTLVKVVSRKTHGSPGQDFDVDLTPPASGIECRSGGPNGDYTMVFTFSNPITSCGVASSGAATPGPNSNQCTVQLTGVPNAQYKTVQLTGVIDNNMQPVNAAGTMGVLIGDVTANGVVTNTDVGAVKGQVDPTRPVTETNFRDDVSVNGFVTNTDVGAVKAQVNPTGGLPPHP
jgi:hypothetical protein